MIESSLAGFLDRFRERYPGVEVQLVEEGGTNLPGRLERGHILLALMAADDERFDYRLLHLVLGLAVMSKTHKLVRRHTLDVAELADEPLVLLRGGFASRDWFESACSAAHIWPRAVLESAAPQTAIALAGSGYGIAMVPSTVQIPHEYVHAAALMRRGAVPGGWLRVAWDSQRFLASYAQRLVEELVPYCERGYPGHELMRYVPRKLRPNKPMR